MTGGTEASAGRIVAQRYELETLIGRGGIGEVWRARHLALNSRVAIKFLHGASAQKESVRRRFTNEAQITAQLKTPNAVQVFDFGFTDEGQPFLVMELLEGETLGHRLERVKRLTAAETVAILGPCARALQRAHQLGIVHRDFKPDNVVICADSEGAEQVKVLDFGIAKLVGALEGRVSFEGGDSAGGPGSTRGTMSSFTRTGSVLGTPLYMAPEQVRDATEVDMRADIWALGVVAFECLTGQVPFKASTIPELFARIQEARHPRAEFLVDDLKPGFDGWFEVACAPDPGARYPSAIIAFRQLAAALEVGTTDDSSKSLGSSGEGPRVVVVAAQDKPTDDVRAEGVQGSARHGELGSIGRIGLRTTERPPPRPSGDPLASATTHDGDAKRSHLGWTLAAGATVAAAVAVAVVLLPRARVAPPPTATTGPPAPIATPSEAASTAEGTALPVAATAPSSTPPSSLPTSRQVPRRAPRLTDEPQPVAEVPKARASATAPAAPPSPPPSVAVTASPPPPAALPALTATSVPDPGSYR